MSAALQLAAIWATSPAREAWQIEPESWEEKPAAGLQDGEIEAEAEQPPVGLAFYRKHTQNMLRRYLYASTQVGRAPSLLRDPVARGWASNRPVRTFEDAVIFVLDVEKCLDELGALDRELLSRIVLQEYTQAEAAALLGISARSVSSKFGAALDRLTEKLLKSGQLILPQ
jgi:predicted DNA-binding protein (UPF0251 family)